MQDLDSSFGEIPLDEIIFIEIWRKTETVAVSM